MRRQRQTAEAIFDALNHRQDSITRHINAGFDEMNTEQQLEAIIPLLIDKDSELKHLIDNPDGSKKTFQKVLKHVFCYWVLESPDVARIESWKSF